jgi:hypothetical protein
VLRLTWWSVTTKVFARKGGHFVPGKKVPAFIYDSPGTLERGTQLSLLAVKGKYPDESSSLSAPLSGSWNVVETITFQGTFSVERTIETLCPAVSWTPLPPCWHSDVQSDALD